MPERQQGVLTRKEAIGFLGLEDKQFDNFFKTAGEFSCLPRRRRGKYLFDKFELSEWKKDYSSRTVTLKLRDYYRCLDFAVAMYYRGYVPADWGTGRQREFGQLVSNWVRGQLGELALAEYARRMLGVGITIDFELHKEIVPQDVLAISLNGRKRKPRYRIAVKASKPKSAYLVLSKNEVKKRSRISDVYVFVRVDLPDDHLIRIASRRVRSLLRGQQHFNTYSSRIRRMPKIQAEVAGFACRGALQRKRSIPGQRFSGYRWVMRSGELHRSVSWWRRALR